MRAERFVIALLVVAVGALALRPVSSARATAPEESFSIAVCALPTIVNELMSSERFAEEREDLTAEFEEDTAEIESRMNQIRDDVQGMGPDDPAMGAIQEEFFSLRQQLFRRQTEFQTASARLQARHLKESYQLVRASAVAIAEDLGYDFVFASASPEDDDELNDQDAALLLGQLSRRPVIKFPEAHDITDDVRDDLNL
ncbi:MAG: hypothetical protein Tsb0013_04120 [Phycisphaerales bacterium]